MINENTEVTLKFKLPMVDVILHSLQNVEARYSITAPVVQELDMQVRSQLAALQPPVPEVANKDVGTVPDIGP